MLSAIFELSPPCLLLIWIQPAPRERVFFAQIARSTRTSGVGLPREAWPNLHSVPGCGDNATTFKTPPRVLGYTVPWQSAPLLPVTMKFSLRHFPSPLAGLCFAAMLACNSGAVRAQA